MRLRAIRVLVATVVVMVLGSAVAFARADAQQRVAARDDLRAPAPGGVDEPRLETLLTLQRAVCPGAVVTGRFLDWRAESRYRRHAGLHLGYDVAMPAGTPAVAGWTGQVTRILPWYGNEHGITVLSPSGYQVTYGHLVPRVRVGDVLNAGEVVGFVVVDHVDVKMQSPLGQYFDFGAREARAGHIAFPSGMPGAVPDGAGRSDAVALLAAEEATVARLRELEEASRGSLARQRVALQGQRSRVESLRCLMSRGAVARLEVESEEERVRQAESRVAEVEACWQSARSKLAVHRGRLLMLRRAAGSAPGAEERGGEERGTAGAAPIRGARDDVLAGPSPAVGPSSRDAARVQLGRLELLYRRGAISRNDLERARRGLATPAIP